MLTLSLFRRFRQPNILFRCVTDRVRISCLTRNVDEAWRLFLVYIVSALICRNKDSKYRTPTVLIFLCVCPCCGVKAYVRSQKSSTLFAGTSATRVFIVLYQKHSTDSLGVGISITIPLLEGRHNTNTENKKQIGWIFML